MKKIPLILLNGNLGSGKTTLVKRLLQSTDFAGSFLIENEYASVNIDREALAEEHDEEIYEISGSCICCSTGEELEEALNAIVEKGWDKPVILEATGMANSATLLRRLYLNPDFVRHFQVLSSILVLDAVEADPAKIDLGTDLEIRLADIILINKTDLAKPAVVSALEDYVQKGNPGAVVKSTSHANINTSLIGQKDSNVETVFAEVFSDVDKVVLEEATYAVLELNRPLEPKAVEAALRPEAFAPQANLRRAKGFFLDPQGNQWQVEATAKHIDLKQLRKPKQQVLVAIGEGITKQLLEEVLA